MTQQLAYTFELFGPSKNYTGELNGHFFTNGICPISVDPINSIFVMRKLSYYKAYAKGTPEYEKEKDLENANKVHEVEDTGEGLPLFSDRGPNGIEPPKETSTVLSGHADSDASSRGYDTDGDGHEHSGVPKFEEEEYRQLPVEPQGEVDNKLVFAIKALDPTDNSHWVSTGRDAGKPRLSAVAALYGKDILSRSDIENAAPGFTRETAQPEI